LKALEYTKALIDTFILAWLLPDDGSNTAFLSGEFTARHISIYVAAEGRCDC
jgi:hypothetical protein